MSLGPRLDGWLPVKYFTKAFHKTLDSTASSRNVFQAVKINYSTCDIEELDFDRAVSMPSWVGPARTGKAAFSPFRSLPGSGAGPLGPWGSRWATELLAVRGIFRLPCEMHRR